MTVPRKGRDAVKQQQQSAFRVLNFVLVGRGGALCGCVLLTVVVLCRYLEYPSSYSYTLQRNNSICPHMVLAGDRGDGSYWMCGPSTIPTTTTDPCTVYSFGISTQYSFDVFLAQQGCHVHGFDPTIITTGAESNTQYAAGGHHTNNMVLHNYAIGAADTTYGRDEVPFRWPGLGYLQDTNTVPWEIKRLPTIMKENGHEKLTILKIDVEGAEWDSMEDIWNTDWDELYMEIHFPPGHYRLSRAWGGGLTVARGRALGQFHRNRPARNVPGRIDRIAILKTLEDVADLFYWEFNGLECAEVHFKRKASTKGKAIEFKVQGTPSPYHELE